MQNVHEISSQIKKLSRKSCRGRLRNLGARGRLRNLAQPESPHLWLKFAFSLLILLLWPGADWQQKPPEKD